MQELAVVALALSIYVLSSQRLRVMGLPAGHRVQRLTGSESSLGLPAPIQVVSPQFTVPILPCRSMIFSHFSSRSPGGHWRPPC
jgi:hypothetical protein